MAGNGNTILGLVVLSGLGYALLKASKPAESSIAGGGGAGAGSGGALLFTGAPSPAEAPSKTTTAEGTTTGGRTPVPVQPLQPVLNIYEAPLEIPAPSKDSGENGTPIYKPSSPQYTPSQQPVPSKKEQQAQKIAEQKQQESMKSKSTSWFVSEPEFEAQYGKTKKEVRAESGIPSPTYEPAPKMGFFKRVASQIEGLFRYGWGRY